MRFSVNGHVRTQRKHGRRRIAIVITRPLVILGTGRIARVLLNQLLARADYLRDRHALALPVAAVANSRYYAVGAPYLDDETLGSIAAGGLEKGERVPDAPAQQQSLLIDGVRAIGERAIVVDLTASDSMTPLLLAALDGGFDAVLANKKPLCEEYGAFVRLTTNPRARIGYEATVGAGLPVVETLRGLYDAGDELLDVTACLSGTLAYVCTELEDGRPLSAIVPEARRLGYTEPDPREDLGGADVRRKALILARTMGQRLEMDDVPEAPLVALDDGPLDAWLAGLSRHDAALDERVRAAHEQGLALRYVARLVPGRCEVGLREVPRSSAAGRLRGTDNLVTLRTSFYDERPLTVSGRGAGPAVTSAGVFGDLLRLAISG